MKRTKAKAFISVPLLSFALNAHAAAPVATDDARTINVNSSLTVNVLANDFDEDGDSLSVIEASNGEFGSTQINGDGSIIYTPANGFIGVDTFTYTIQENIEGGETASATVTVNVVENAYSQLPLSENTLNFAAAFANYCRNLRDLSDAEAGAIRRQMALRCDALELLAQENPELTANVLQQIAPEETLSMLRNALDSGRTQSQVVSQRIGHIQSGGPAISFNGMPLTNGATGGAAGDTDSLWSTLGVFISAQIEQAEREQSQRENGYDTESNSITLGVDYRFSGATVFGVALGLSESNLVYANNAGEFDTQTLSGILFGAWQLGRFSLESQLGYSEMQFESERYLRYSDGQSNINLAMLGETYGTQQLFNVQAQWEWQKNALSLYPYLRLEYQNNQVKAYEEIGGLGYSVGLEDQEATQTTAALGIQGTYAMKFNWGVLLPNIEITGLSEVQSDRSDAVGYFIFDTENTRFTLQNDGGDRSFFQLGVGASAVMKHGISSFIQYKQISGYQFFKAWQVQAGLRFEL